MNHYPLDRDLSSESDLLDYYLAAIGYRNTHKEDSSAIAVYVFDKTHPMQKLSFRVSKEVDQLRDEFGALEAPGMPEDDEKNPQEYDDELWVRLFNLITKIKQNRIV